MVQNCMNSDPSVKEYCQSYGADLAGRCARNACLQHVQFSYTAEVIHAAVVTILLHLIRNE